MSGFTEQNSHHPSAYTKVTTQMELNIKVERLKDTPLGQIFRLMYTSGNITVRKRKQLSVTVEDTLCCKTHKNITVKVKVPSIHAVKAYGGVEI